MFVDFPILPTCFMLSSILQFFMSQLFRCVVGASRFPSFCLMFGCWVFMHVLSYLCPCWFRFSVTARDGRRLSKLYIFETCSLQFSPFISQIIVHLFDIPQVDTHVFHNGFSRRFILSQFILHLSLVVINQLPITVSVSILNQFSLFRMNRCRVAPVASRFFEV